MMTDDQLLRYNRQIMLPAIDIAGQEKLLAARVLIIGVGGLGSPVALYLAAAGVGTLVLTDHDTVDLSNLQRQIVHSTRDIDRPKVMSATDRIHALNPDTEVLALPCRLQGNELKEQVELATIVVDCTDNFETRTEINTLCAHTSTPLVSGAAIGFGGQVAIFCSSAESPCYNCLYPDLSDQQLSCSEAGILSPVTGVIGSLQAVETIKLIVGIGNSLDGRLLLFDGMAMEWRTMKLSRDSNCQVCNH